MKELTNAEAMERAPYLWTLLTLENTQIGID